MRLLVPEQTAAIDDDPELTVGVGHAEALWANFKAGNGLVAMGVACFRGAPEARGRKQASAHRQRNIQQL